MLLKDIGFKRIPSCSKDYYIYRNKEMNAIICIHKEKGYWKCNRAVKASVAEAIHNEISHLAIEDHIHRNMKR